jgi:hypothetical protein
MSYAGRRGRDHIVVGGDLPQAANKKNYNLENHLWKCKYM